MQQPLGRTLSVHRGLFKTGGWLLYIGTIFILSFFVNFFNEEFGLAIGSGICGALCISVLVLRWNQSLKVFERGLVWKRLTGCVTIDKDDVTAAKMTTHNNRMGHSIEIEILLSDGTEFCVVGLNDSEQLYNTVNAWARQYAQKNGADMSALEQNPVSVSSSGWTPPL